jgi:RluA family pseudouridine synthase
MPHGRDFEVVVPSDYDAEERLDKYLAEAVPDVSRSKVQDGIREELVTINGQTVTKKSRPVEAGDRLVGTVPLPPPPQAEPEPIPLDVAYEDDALIAVRKPAGMVVHPAPGHRTGTLVNALLHHVGANTAVKAEDASELRDDDVGLSLENAWPGCDDSPVVRPGIVHRLDKDTTGLLVVAKDDVAHRRLAAQFAEHTVERTYHAIVWGRPEPPSGRIEGRIGRDPHDRKRMAVVPEDRGKRATTHYETLERHRHTALVAFQLETGRTHQIRVHASHRHHPVLGDAKYGGRAVRYGSTGGTRERFFEHLFEKMPRQALHARSLGFVHPKTDEWMHFEAALPDDMQHVLGRLRDVEGDG